MRGIGFASMFGTLVVGSVVSFTSSAGCGSSSSDSPPAPAALKSFAPPGCSYEVVIPDRLALVDVAAHDAGAAGSAPARVRIGLGGNITAGTAGYADPLHTAAFTWETPERTRATEIRFGVRPDALDQRSSGYAWTTPQPEIGFGASDPETYMHEVHLCGLGAGTTYYYQVGGGSPEVWSATQTFTTLPDHGPVKLGILGDSRDRVDVWALAQRRVKAAGAQLQMTTGDLVVFGAQESLIQQWLDAIWKDPERSGDFLTLGQQMMLMTSGNHEGEAARFYAAFSIPGEGPWAEAMASFDVGNTHFVMVDDQTFTVFPNSEEGNAVLAWLESDLTKADANRAKIPFVTVVAHRGLFTTSNHADDSDVALARQLLVPIYDRHHVDLVVNGHDHAFERTKAMRAGAVAADGTYYLVNAGAGADPYAVKSADFIEKSATFGTGTPYVGFYGIVTMEDRKLTFTSYGLTTSGPDPVVDVLELSK